MSSRPFVALLLLFIALLFPQNSNAQSVQNASLLDWPASKSDRASDWTNAPIYKILETDDWETLWQENTEAFENISEPYQNYMQAWISTDRDRGQFCRVYPDFVKTLKLKILADRIIERARLLGYNNFANNEYNRIIAIPPMVERKYGQEFLSIALLSEDNTAPKWLSGLAGSLFKYGAANWNYQYVMDALEQSCNTNEFDLSKYRQELYYNYNCNDLDYVRLMNYFFIDIRFLHEIGVNSIHLYCSKYKAIDLDGYELSNITIENSIVDYITMKRSNLKRFSIKNSVIGTFKERLNTNLNAYGSKIKSDIEFSNTTIYGAVELGRTNIGGGLFLDKTSTIDVGQSICGCDRIAFDMSFASAQNITLGAARVNGTALFNGLNADNFSMIGTHIDGSLVLTDAVLTKTLQIAAQDGRDIDRSSDVYPAVVGRAIHASGLTANSVNIAHAWVGQDLDLDGLKIESALNIKSTIVNRSLSLRQSQLLSFNARYVIATSLLLDGSVIGGNSSGGAVIVENSIFEVIDFSLLQASNVEINLYNRPNDSYEIQFPERLPTECTPASKPIEKLLKEHKIEVDANRESKNWKDFRKELVIALEQRPAFGCIGIIELSGANLEGQFILEGEVIKGVDLSAAFIANRTSLRGNLTRYGSQSEIRARGLKTEAIVFNVPARQGNENGCAVHPSTEEKGEGPISFDLFGASFNIITPANPETGNRLEDFQVAERICIFLQANSDKKNGGVNVSPTGPQYQPNIYDTLAAGYEKAGDKDYARFVKIEKNRAYAALSSTSTVTWVVYRIADLVSGYGQEPLNGLLILIGLTVVGWCVASAEIVYSLRLQKASPKKPGRPKRTEITPRSWRRHMMRRALFSVDRSLPSLNLDSRFGDQDAMELNNYASIWFYFQRMASFIVISLMVAGALDMFQ